MSKVNLALTENYYFNNMLGRAILGLLPQQERAVLLTWFDKLYDMKKEPAELELRKDYMLFILLMLQCRKIKEPFTSPPPETLIPLKKAVTRKNYEEVLIANDEVMNPDDVPEEGPVMVQVAPASFFGFQPQPNEGVMVYTAVFSDQGKS